MANNQYFENKLIGSIGRVKIDVDIDNPFPFVGDTVNIKSTTKWAQLVKYIKKQEPNGQPIEDIIENTSQNTMSSIIINDTGDVPQIVEALNYKSDGTTVLFDAVAKKYVYPMRPQQRPYFCIQLSSEINRTNEYFDIIISQDNGYDLSRSKKIDLYILKESSNVNGGTILHLTESDFTLTDGQLIVSGINIDKRGIYDIYVEYTDLENKETTKKREDKILSITPRLAARPEDGQEPNAHIDSSTPNVRIDLYKTGVNDLYMEFVIPNLSFYKDIDIKSIPEGYDCYTMVLKLQEELPDGSQISRIRFENSTVVPDGITNPTPQFSYDNPLVITHDSNTFLELHGESYNTISFNKLWYSIIDGRGYHNVQKGIRLTKNPKTGEQAIIHMQYSTGSSYMEIFEVEMSECSFAGISAKTDPNEKNPQYWFGNFEQRDFWIHHNYIHDTEGEGVYIGYFTPEIRQKVYTGEDVSFTNLNGEKVQYINGRTYDVKAHYLPNLKFYRNNIKNTGFDGIQLSSTFGDVCYNQLINCAWKEEMNQASGASIQSFSGNFYNNFLYNNHGPSIQLGPIGECNIYNNIIYSTYGNGIQFLFSYSTPEQNPSGATAGSGIINDDVKFNFYNNVLIAPGITANGRNTVQMTGLHMYDNIIGNNGTLFSNMTIQTLDKWKDQAINNIIFNYNDIVENSEKYKIADYSKGDFRIAYDSPLINQGLGTSFVSDYRGYINWYNDGTSPIGPFMGKYRDSSIVEIPLVITKLTINNGEEQTQQNIINISYEYEGTATHIRISENDQFTGSEWIQAAQSIPYTINEGEYGLKTIYVQLKNSISQSNILQGQIEYVEPQQKPVVLSSIHINGGQTITEDREVSVSMDYEETDTKAILYRASENDNDINTQSWNDIENPFRFVLSEGYGIKNIYVQLKDDAGNETEILSSSIEYKEQQEEKAVLSILWEKNEFQEKDNINKITSSLVDFPVKTNKGNIFCNIKRLDISSGYQIFKDTYAGQTTGDNSFDYPDEYMYRSAVFGSRDAKSLSYILSSINPKKYCVRLFSSNINSGIKTERCVFKLITNKDQENQKEYVFDNPKEIIGNISEWMVQEVDIPQDGTMILDQGITAGSSYVFTSLNIIEIKDVIPATSIKINLLNNVDNIINLGCTFYPANTTQNVVDWTFKNSTQNASINRFGEITINPTAVQEEIIEVIATNKFNNSIVDSIKIPIKYS